MISGFYRKEEVGGGHSLPRKLLQMCVEITCEIQWCFSILQPLNDFKGWTVVQVVVLSVPVSGFSERTVYMSLIKTWNL